MKKTMIIFVVISVLFHHLFAQQEVASDTSSFAKEQKNDFSFKYLMRSDDIPAYEKIPVLSNYRENQMIKGMIKGGTIGFFPAAGISFLYMDDEGLTWGYGLLAIAGLGAGTLTGGIIGCFRGAKYHKIKTNNPGFHLKKEFIEHEMKINNSKKNWSVGYFLNIQKPVFFFDELQIGFEGIRWDDWLIKKVGNYEDIHYAFEKKFSINAMNYFSNNVLSIYCGIGAGYSKGYLTSNSSEYEDKNIKALFTHNIIGLKLNIFDFFYLKCETNYELLIYKWNEHPAKRGLLVYQFSFGAYIF